MAAALAEVLEAVRATIASSTGADVGLGDPVESRSGLFVLPYKIQQDPMVRSTPSIPAGGQTVQAEWHVIVNCLLVANSPDGYAALGEGLSSILEVPEIVLGATRITINSPDLPAQELATICMSAGVPLRLAVPLELRWALGR